MLSPFKSTLDAIPYPAWTCNAFGAVDYVNAAGTEYTGLVPAQSGQQRTIWADVIAADQYETFADQLQSAMRTSTAFHRDVRISRGRTVDGYRWYSISICPIFAADGIVQSWIGIAVEVEDRTRAERAEAALYDCKQQYEQEQSRSTLFQDAVLPAHLPEVPGSLV